MEDEKSYIIYTDLNDGKKFSCFSLRRKIPKPSIVTLTVFLSILALLILFPFLQKEHLTPIKEICNETCKFTIVESLPEGIQFDAKFSPSSTFELWKRLIQNAKHNISIASSYWTLRSSDVYKDNSSWMGQIIFDLLYESSLNRGIILRIVQNYAEDTPDTTILAQSANAKVRKLNFRKFSNYGILHTKLWIFDEKDFYIGSANMDWRSLSQVKEMGLVGENCTCLAKDLNKIFQAYWYLSDPDLYRQQVGNFLQNSISNRVQRETGGRERYPSTNLDVFWGQSKVEVPPNVWPDNYTASFNSTQPAFIHSGHDNYDYHIYMASSPLLLNGPSRTNDIDAILNCINEADKFVYISVMEYMPGTLYLPIFQYWPVIDEALKRAAFDRNIKVKLLISYWKHSNVRTFHFLKSLLELTYTGYVNIQIKIMIIPITNNDQKHIPFARVNHNKIMVTDKAAYIGTSNWSADYFLWTGGVSIIFKPVSSENGTSTTFEQVEKHSTLFQNYRENFGNVRDQLEFLFMRDWSSNYTVNLQNFTLHKIRL